MRVAFMSLLVCIALAGTALAQGIDNPGPIGNLRIGADLGGRYTTNVYGNASDLADAVGRAVVAIDGNLTPSPSVVLKLDYRGELALYRELTEEYHYGHTVGLTAGWRPADRVYLQLVGGCEHAYYPDRPAYDFWGIFGRGTARFEVGETATVEVGYRLRGDQFPSYDLDNLAHRVEAYWSMVPNDFVELELPGWYEVSFYDERYVLDATGAPTSDKRNTHRIMATPTMLLLPTFDLEVAVRAIGEVNISEDAYYAEGPFGAADPAADPELVRHFDSYWFAGGRLDARWLLLDDLMLAAFAEAGLRRFPERPAYDLSGVNKGENEQDLVLFTGVEAELRLWGALSLRLAYAFMRQASNDDLWDYDRHRVDVTVGTWWEN